MPRLKLALLDRDGVINRKAPEGEYICRPEQFHFLPGVPEAIRLLNENEVTVVVLTNQRGIALGLYDEAQLSVIHDRLRSELAEANARLDGIYFCPHDDKQCDCRKPKTGLLELAFRDFPFATRDNSVLIGDSLPDIQAGTSFGIRTVFVEGDASIQKKGASEARSSATGTAASLLEAVEQLLSHDE